MLWIGRRQLYLFWYAFQASFLRSLCSPTSSWDYQCFVKGEILTSRLLFWWWPGWLHWVGRIVQMLSLWFGPGLWGQGVSVAPLQEWTWLLPVCTFEISPLRWADWGGEVQFCDNQEVVSVDWASCLLCVAFDDGFLDVGGAENIVGWVRFFMFCASRVGISPGSSMSSSYPAIRLSRGWAAVELVLLKRWWLFMLSHNGWWWLKSLSKIMPSTRLVLWLVFHSSFSKCCVRLSIVLECV